MNGDDVRRYASVALKAMEQARGVFLRNYGAEVSWSAKSERDPVSEVDLEIESRTRDFLAARSSADFIGEELGGLLGQRCVKALGIQAEQAQSYGKAAIVGEAGELEHAAAILHPKLGAPLRLAVSKGAALVPSAKKQGSLGTAIDVPLGHKDAAFVRRRQNSLEVFFNTFLNLPFIRRN